MKKASKKASSIHEKHDYGKDGGMNAFGKPVTQDRQNNAYKFLKEHFGFDSDTALSIVEFCSKSILDDMPYNILAPLPTHENTAKIDVTGRYMLLSHLLVG